MEIPQAVHDAFVAFQPDASLFALPITFSDTELQSLSPISYPKVLKATFQAALNQLDDVLSPKSALYLLLRRTDSLVAVTYVPYLAKAEQRALFLENRLKLVQKLGSEHFASSIICKEMGEITDARSWDERDDSGRSWDSNQNKESSDCETCEKVAVEGQAVKDMGYKKNTCRLCDRRMKNKIEDDALEALVKLNDGGNCVQLSVDVSTEVLQLNLQAQNVTPSEVAQKLPADCPSFTFYCHPDHNLLYFIFCSPDSATVQQRMKHTMAIPGLVNIIARDNGVNVDQKIEIHDPEDLVFEEKDERIGKFRSMYLRNESVGTESRWEGMDEYQKVLDSVH